MQDKNVQMGFPSTSIFWRKGFYQFYTSYIPKSNFCVARIGLKSFFGAGVSPSFCPAAKRDNNTHAAALKENQPNSSETEPDGAFCSSVRAAVTL